MLQANQQHTLEVETAERQMTDRLLPGDPAAAAAAALLSGAGRAGDSAD